MAEFKLPMQYQSAMKIPKNIKIGSGEYLRTSAHHMNIQLILPTSCYICAKLVPTEIIITYSQMMKYIEITFQGEI